MLKIRRWVTSKRRVVWSEPALPPYVKINPAATPDPDGGLQPGDLSMARAAEEFLAASEDEEIA
jgi:hypothetical protein